MIFMNFLSAEPIFIGIISEKHWAAFCREFDREDLLKRPEFQSNNLRIDARDLLLPDLKRMLAGYTRAEAMVRCEAAQIHRET